MRFPCHMVERKITNNYDMIGCTFALLLRCFKEEDNWFAAQCIWWLASIIQYIELLRFHLEYNTFPSEYLRDCVVTPLPEKLSDELIISNENI